MCVLLKSIMSQFFNSFSQVNNVTIFLVVSRVYFLHFYILIYHIYLYYIVFFFDKYLYYIVLKGVLSLKVHLDSRHNHSLIVVPLSKISQRMLYR